MPALPKIQPTPAQTARPQKSAGASNNSTRRGSRTRLVLSRKQRAEAIIKDILVNHLPRVQEGLELGYIDENQILVIYDHAVRARILKETA